MESILITGASGFIGSFIVEEALKRKFGVWAGVRSSSSREYLRDRKIHFLELDFAHPNELRAQLSEHKGTYNKFDYIVHCAGVTKCVDKNEFDLVNYLQTKYFIDTLRELNMIPKQFIFISTLSVFGPVRERTYDPIMESDPPSPNTAYGLSKLKTELYLQSIPGFPYAEIYGVSLDELLKGEANNSSKSEAEQETVSGESADNTQIPTGDEGTEYIKADKVSFKNGIHVDAKNGDKVHISFADGIHVQDKDGTKVDR